MSAKYDEYLEEHIENVKRGFEWLKTNVPKVFVDEAHISECESIINEHDKSKYDRFEYNAYDAYFYGNKSYEVVKDFNYAWLMHIHKNPHHWQHWVLINDDPEEGEKVLDMPYDYIVEMICDWMSFAMKKNDLNELFKWYEEHEDHMKLSSYTRDRVESILTKIKVKLEEDANVARVD